MDPIPAIPSTGQLAGLRMPPDPRLIPMSFTRTARFDGQTFLAGDVAGVLPDRAAILERTGFAVRLTPKPTAPAAGPKTDAAVNGPESDRMIRKGPRR